jgi:uncharacterized protein YndB with AHSA1/START domain
MASWESSVPCDASGAQVMAALTDPDAIKRWSPVAFRIIGRRPRQLRSGDTVYVVGTILGW